LTELGTALAYRLGQVCPAGTGPPPSNDCQSHSVLGGPGRKSICRENPAGRGEWQPCPQQGTWGLGRVPLAVWGGSQDPSVSEILRVILWDPWLQDTGRVCWRSGASNWAPETMSPLGVRIAGHRWLRTVVKWPSLSQPGVLTLLIPASQPPNSGVHV
jgi:hypothetical protein